MDIERSLIIRKEKLMSQLIYCNRGIALLYWSTQDAVQTWLHQVSQIGKLEVQEKHLGP